MNYNVPYYGFIRNFGIDEIYSVQPGRFTSTTILATRGAQKVTVSDVLKAAGYLNDFIKSNFDVTDTRYSETLLFLKTMGGLSFPIHFPLAIPEIQVVWNYSESLTVNSQKQQRACETLFANKPIIDTLLPLGDKKNTS